MYLQARVRAGHATASLVISAPTWLMPKPALAYPACCDTLPMPNVPKTFPRRATIAAGAAKPQRTRLKAINACSRTFVTTHSACKTNNLPPRPTVDEDEFTKRSLKGSGPGGQKINKTNSAIQLRHLPTGIVVKCQATRSRSQNEKIARRILAEKIELLQKGDQSRVALKAERASRKKRSAEKKSRRKYRKLAEEQLASASAGEEIEGGDEVESASGLDGQIVLKRHGDGLPKEVDRESYGTRQATGTKETASLNDTDIVIEGLEDEWDVQVDEPTEMKDKGSFHPK